MKKLSRVLKKAVYLPALPLLLNLQDSFEQIERQFLHADKDLSMALPEVSQKR